MPALPAIPLKHVVYGYYSPEFSGWKDYQFTPGELFRPREVVVFGGDKDATLEFRICHLQQFHVPPTFQALRSPFSSPEILDTIARESAVIDDKKMEHFMGCEVKHTGFYGLLPLECSTMRPGDCAFIKANSVMRALFIFGVSPVFPVDSPPPAAAVAAE